MIRIFKKVTAKLHPKERKVIGKLRVTVIGEIDRLEERFMEERGVKAFARQSGGWADRRMIIMLGKHKVTEAFFEHELGHVLSSVYGGIARNELFGIHWHFRNHILAHWDKDRSHNHYSKSSTEEWFTEARRLMRSKKPLMPRNILENYSTNDEFCAKDPVGYLVFKRYFHLLKKGAKHPEYAFSMSSFHQARVYVEIFTGQRRAFVSNGRINSDFVAGWNRLKIDMRAESLVRRGNMLYKKAEKRVKNGQRNVAKLLSRAKSYYVKALRMIPEFSLARMQLADVYSLRSEIESEKIPAKMLRRQAIEQLKVAIKSDPLNHNAGLKLAELYRSEGLLQEALRVYDSFMPKFSLLHINLDRVSDIVTERAELLYGLGQYREVVDSLVRLADRHGLSEDSAWLLSLAANNIGAKRAYEIARKKLKELMEDDF
jgi:tetratricopeptide (TPR) repeat protein